MKRTLILAVAALLACAPYARSQGVKVDVEDLKARMAKSDADAANPKKNTKANMWLDRGKLYQEVADAPTKGAYQNMDEKAADMMFGKKVGSATTKKIGDKSYRVVNYNNITIYETKTGEEPYKVQFWTPKTQYDDQALPKALEAYMKAYEIDKGTSTAGKVAKGQEAISNLYREYASNYFSLQEYTKAAEAFAGSADAMMPAPANVVDTLGIFNAGFLYTVAQKFELGAKYLNEALKYGYENEGDAYYYLYHCYYGLKEVDKAKDVLVQGLAKWPNNTKIVEGLLTVYTTGEGDPKEIVPLVQKAIDNDPNNVALLSGLGLVYDKLGDVDSAIATFEKAAKLLPKDYNTAFNLGLLYIKKGDKLNGEFTKQVYSTKEEYETALATVNKVYVKAVAPLEKALNLKKGDANTIELLKNLTFRLRDEPGMMDKYNQYKDMFDALPPAAAPAEAQ